MLDSPENPSQQRVFVTCFLTVAITQLGLHKPLQVETSQIFTTPKAEGVAEVPIAKESCSGLLQLHENEVALPREANTLQVD